MTSRADLVNTVEQTLIEVVYQGLGISAAVDRIVDAAMPQITTAEQLEALPDGALLATPWGWQVYRWRGALRLLHGVMDGFDREPVDVLSRDPLTVVWQPQPDQETR